MKATLPIACRIDARVGGLEYRVGLFGFKHFYGLDLASVAWQVLENMKMAVAGKMPR